MNLRLSSHKNFLNTFLFTFFVILCIFGRTFMGLNIFIFRLGELVFGFSALFFIYTLIKSFLYKVDKDQSLKVFDLIFIGIVLHALFLIIFYKYSFFDLYPFKASSYIWVLGSFYFGRKINFFNISGPRLVVLFITLSVSYYLSIFGISEYFQNQILNFTDKFDYLKGSDLLIFYLFIGVVLMFSLKKEKIMPFYLVFGMFYLPLVMNKSRGGSIAFLIILIFLIIDFLKNSNSITKNLLILCASILVFIISTFIVSKSPLELSEIEERIVVVSTGRYQKPVQNVPAIEYPTIYFEMGRIHSGDGNLNWRFQIWQDVIEDLNFQNKLLIGYGYNSKIPAMDVFYRAGNDGTNENVHNYFINILARGGLIHLILYILFFINLFVYFNKNSLKKEFLFLFLPVMITSFFDASMENSHFPVLFYFLIGNIVQSNEIKNNHS